MKHWRKARSIWPQSRKTAFYQMFDNWAHRNWSPDHPQYLSGLERRFCDAFDYHVTDGIQGKSLWGKLGTDEVG